MRMGLLCNEFRRAVRGSWFKGTLLVGVALAMWAAGCQITSYIGGPEWIIREYAQESYYYHSAYSCFSTWMPVHDGSDAASMFFTLLPLLVLMAYSWSFAGDVRSGYIYQIATRTSRRRLYMAKYGAVFLSAGLVAVIPLVLNLLVLACFLPAYTPSVVDSMYIGMNRNEIFSEVFYSAPLLYAVLRVGLNFLLCGLWAVMVLAFSTLTSNRIALVCAPYIVLLFVKHAGENLYAMMRLRGFEGFGTSVTLFDQLKGNPDSYYCYWWVTLLCMLLMLFLSLLVPYVRRRADVA